MAPRKRLKAFVLRTSCSSSKEEYDLFSAPRSNDFFSPQRNRHQLITTICTETPVPCLGQGHTRALHYLHDSRDVFRGGDFATECRAERHTCTRSQVCSLPPPPMVSPPAGSRFAGPPPVSPGEGGRGGPAPATRKFYQQIPGYRITGKS